MKNQIIDKFLNPKSVAVIGASKNPFKGGYRITNNLVLNNFKGDIYPVNPNSEGKLFGLEFKKSVLEIEDEIDLAIIYVPNKAIPDILSQCIEKGIKGAIIEASGFEEVGGEGLELRDQILSITENFSKIRLVGPNCMGISRIDRDSESKNDEMGGFFTSFVEFTKYKRGNVGIISQSGMLNGGYLLHVMEKYPTLGLRYSCSIGNKMDLSEIEFLDYMIADPTINVIALYLESFKDPRKFIKLCKKVQNIPHKTIILVKGGSTAQGQKATLSHTGSLAENSQLIEAVIRQSGVIKANNFFELFQFIRTFSMIYKTEKILPKKGNVAMVTGSGGAGSISADITIKYGLNYPILKENAYEELVKLFPDWMPPNKFALVDIWPTMEKAMMNKVNPGLVMNSIYEILLKEEYIEGLMIMMFCSNRFKGLTNFDNTIKNISKIPKPVLFWLIGDLKEIRRVSQLLDKYSLLHFQNLEDMIKNTWVLYQESMNKHKN